MRAAPRLKLSHIDFVMKIFRALGGQSREKRNARYRHNHPVFKLDDFPALQSAGHHDHIGAVESFRLSHMRNDIFGSRKRLDPFQVWKLFKPRHYFHPRLLTFAAVAKGTDQSSHLVSLNIIGTNLGEVSS